MGISDLMPLVSLHLKFNPLYHNAELRARHLDAIEKACDAVRDMPASVDRVTRFIKVYNEGMKGGNDGTA